jgi:hypothetical protein
LGDNQGRKKGDSARYANEDPISPSGVYCPHLPPLLKTGDISYAGLPDRGRTEGVSAVEALDLNVLIVAAALARELNARKYILPGLGDIGDRLYGT